jgi:hypothetical protein
LIGKAVQIALGGVQDGVGNTVEGDVTWSFTVSDFGAAGSSASISGLKLDQKFATFAALAAAKTELATFLGVAESRISNLKASATQDGNTVLSFTILAASGGDTKTATSLSTKLALAVSTVASSFPSGSFPQLSTVANAPVSP